MSEVFSAFRFVKQLEGPAAEFEEPFGRSLRAAAEGAFELAEGELNRFEACE